MTDRAALLAAIIADPDDDLLRLTYADVIEEEGESDRAEFIRLQVEQARLGWGDGGATDRVVELPRLINEIWADQEELDTWDWRFNGSIDWFSRGFIRQVTAKPEYWEHNADAILAANPVQEVTLTTRPQIVVEDLSPEDVGLSRTFRCRASWGKYSILSTRSVLLREIEHDRVVQRVFSIEDAARRQARQLASDPMSFLQHVGEWKRIKKWSVPPARQFTLQEWRELDEAVMRAQRTALRGLQTSAQMMPRSRNDGPYVPPGQMVIIDDDGP